MIKIEPVPLHRATDPDNDSSSPDPDSDKLSVVLQAKATTDQHCTSSPAPGIDEFCPVLQTAATIDQHVSSLPILDSSDARSDLRAHARTVLFWKRLLILASLLVAILFDVPTSALRIHEELQRQAQENANDMGLAAQSSLEDWCLIFRAGLASRRYGNYSGHLLPAPNMGCFFVRLEGQTLTVPIRTGAWRADMMQRLREANFPEPFLACLATTEARLHRVRLSDDFPSAQLKAFRRPIVEKWSVQRACVHACGPVCVCVCVSECMGICARVLAWVLASVCAWMHGGGGESNL